MEAGHLCLVRYADPLWHARLLLAHIEGTTWQILTPDYDRYDEQLDQHNVDYTGFEYLGPSGVVPAHIPAAQVYSFAPMDPGTLALHMQQGRIEAQAERVRRGLAPVAAAPAGLAPVAGVPQVVPPVAPPAGVLGPAVAPAAGAGMVGPQPTFVWVAIEESGGRKRGDVLVVEPAALPAGSLVLGDRALVPSAVAGGSACFAKRVQQQDAASYALEDLRLLPVRFDGQGVRRREFNDAVAHMVEGTPQGGGLQLEGPVTSLNIVKGLRDQNLTPTTFHEFWMRTADIPRGDRSTYEHECLSRIMEAMITVDQLNICSLQSSELVMRRLQVIREAHRISPSSPDYSSADYFMGWKWRKSTQGIDSGLASFVATELKNEAAISKEARKAREEQQARRRPPKGGGGESK